MSCHHGPDGDSAVHARPVAVGFVVPDRPVRLHVELASQLGGNAGRVAIGQEAVDLRVRCVANHQPVRRMRAFGLQLVDHHAQHGVAHFDAAAFALQAVYRIAELEEVSREYRVEGGEVDAVDLEIGCVRESRDWRTRPGILVVRSCERRLCELGRMYGQERARLLEPGGGDDKRFASI